MRSRKFLLEGDVFVYIFARMLNSNNKTMLQKWYLLFMSDAEAQQEVLKGGIISLFFSSVVFFSAKLIEAD